MSYRVRSKMLMTTALSIFCAAHFAAANAQTATTDETTMTAMMTPTDAGVDTPSETSRQAPTKGGDSYSVTAQTAGTWVFSAPADANIKIRVDGKVVMDLQGGGVTDQGTDNVRALVSMSAGDHVVQIDGTGDAGQIEAGPMGSPLRSLNEISEPVETASLDPLSDEQSESISPNAPSTRAANSTERRGFEISGGSSTQGRASQSARVDATNTVPSSLGADVGQMGGMSSAQMSTGSGTTGGSSSTSSGSSSSPFFIGGGSSSNSGSSGSSSQMSNGTTMASLGSGTGTSTNRTGAGSGSAPSRGGSSNGGSGTPSIVSPNPPTTTQPDPDAPVANLSPLSPPASVTLTEEVQLTSGPVGEEGTVSGTGQTLFGSVMDPGSFDIVQVSLAPSGRTTTVDVGPTTGQFSTRIFPEDFAADGTVTVTMTGANSATTEVQSESVSYTLQSAASSSGLEQALSRVTFGATPDLYGRVRAMGFAAYVEEQLNPETINDTAFEATDPSALVDIMNRSGNTVLNGMTNENMAYAAYSEKQLREVMGTFWWNHFHASERDANMYHQAVTDRRFFRENAFGNFGDLLLYSARSPLMSRFLDNNNNRRGNINENYGREILELHTVGVNGGYDDNDVIEVSRIFTGWRYDWVNEDNRDTEGRVFEFEFQPERHDFEDKNVDFIGLNVTGRTGEEGVQEGEELIAALSAEPRTRAYVCGKIVQKFVADQAPANFVDICTAAWEASGGNTREILRAILLDPAYISTAEYQRNKAKTPFEFAASFVRAFGFEPGEDGEGAFYDRLRRAMHNAGMNPTRFPVPTGLPEVSSAWLNSATYIEQYKELNGLANRANRNGSDMQAEILDAGLETAEEVAAFLLGVATSDRYTLAEYEAVIAELKGADGIFEPATEDETIAFRRAIAIVSIAPSFHLQ